MDQQTEERFDTWAVVELFGHARLAGRVSEQQIAGEGFVRIDVPATSRKPALTKLYGPKAIYSLTPTSEELARAVAEQLDAEPINVYVPELRALPAAADPPEVLDQDFTGVDEDPFKEQ